MPTHDIILYPEATTCMGNLGAARVGKETENLRGELFSVPLLSRGRQGPVSEAPLRRHW
jgi:hypothetical protein